jgi:hypothetical protein
MWRYLAGLLLLLGLYLAILGPFTGYLARKPYAEKLGAVARPEVLQALFPDYQELVGAALLTKVFLYFGGLVEAIDDPRQLARATDYQAMSRAVHGALRLDPYNADGYYFGQAVLAWDVGQYRLANELLEYGMRHRTWDWQLPFFAGFNYAYFLKDREAAARMYMRAGELSGQALFKTLAGRYLQEAGETQQAIDYLQTMLAGAREPGVRRTLQLRIAAFEAVLAIEQARDRYLAERNRAPEHIDALVAAGYLAALPVDPYGGRFYLDADGRVASTSKFAFAGQAQGRKQTTPTVPRETAP